MEPKDEILERHGENIKGAKKALDQYRLLYPATRFSLDQVMGAIGWEWAVVQKRGALIFDHKIEDN